MGQILVVDDDPNILQVVKTILERSGFKTLSTNNGPAALKLLKSHDVDILLTDLMMPGMSGGELIEEARRQRPGLPVCCMTAHIPPQSPELEEVLVIAKPFAPRELIHAVRRVSETRPRRRVEVPLASIHKNAKAATAR
jgi:CheY-like chemotaxis protein